MAENIKSLMEKYDINLNENQLSIATETNGEITPYDNAGPRRY